MNHQLLWPPPWTDRALSTLASGRTEPFPADQLSQVELRRHW
jgi:hypothetical protein